ncbi:hypothetical protein Agub_g1503, partial [Astrephomene gubernaculifera]
MDLLTVFSFLGFVLVLILGLAYKHPHRCENMRQDTVPADLDGEALPMQQACGVGDVYLPCPPDMDVDDFYLPMAPFTVSPSQQQPHRSEASSDSLEHSIPFPDAAAVTYVFSNSDVGHADVTNSDRSPAQASQSSCPRKDRCSFETAYTLPGPKLDRNLDVTLSPSKITMTTPAAAARCRAPMSAATTPCRRLAAGSRLCAAPHFFSPQAPPPSPLPSPPPRGQLRLRPHSLPPSARAGRKLFGEDQQEGATVADLVASAGSPRPSRANSACSKSVEAAEREEPVFSSGGAADSEGDAARSGELCGLLPCDSILVPTSVGPSSPSPSSWGSYRSTGIGASLDVGGGADMVDVGADDTGSNGGSSCGTSGGGQDSSEGGSYGNGSGGGGNCGTCSGDGSWGGNNDGGHCVSAHETTSSGGLEGEHCGPGYLDSIQDTVTSPDGAITDTGTDACKGAAGSDAGGGTSCPGTTGDQGSSNVTDSSSVVAALTTPLPARSKGVGDTPAATAENGDAMPRCDGGSSHAGCSSPISGNVGDRDDRSQLHDGRDLQKDSRGPHGSNKARSKSTSSSGMSGIPSASKGSSSS